MYNFNSFYEFITSTLGMRIGNGECWDYINLIWDHLGSKYWTYPPSDPSATNHGVKWGWINDDARNANTIQGLTQIHSLSDIKVGDIVIISDGEYGHGGFAATAYDGSGYLSMYSQNYGYVELVKLDSIPMSGFLGAWRYDAWQDEPEPTLRTNNFKWVLYAKKLRNKSNMV